MKRRLLSAGFCALLCFVFSATISMAQEVIEPVEASSSLITVRVIIATPEQVLSDGSVAVSPCDSDGEGEGPYIVSGYCAVIQLGLTDVWSWWGSDAFLDSLAGYANDSVQNWYWGWYSDLELGQTALNKKILSEGETILLAYNTFPLRLTTSELTPPVGSSVLLTAQQFGYDASWNPAWATAEQATIVVNGTDYLADASGSLVLAITDTAPLTVIAKKTGFVSASSLTLLPVALIEPIATSSGGGSSGGSSEPVSELPVFNLGKAVQYVVAQQEGNGSFGDDRYTDWATIALAAAKSRSNEAAQALERATDYIKRDTLSSSASLTDYERRSLALLAARINPYDGTAFNYIEAILDEFDGEQFGDSGQDNDDIFALLVLGKVGYKVGDEVIDKTIQQLISRQGASGEWIGVDLTAAAIQALRQFENKDSVGAAIERARQYVMQSQQADGGFGNVFTLSWAMQALGDELVNADEALAREQAEDGGMLSVSEADENRLWATAYAIPAHLHKDWSALMKSFQRPAMDEKKEGESADTGKQQKKEDIVTESVLVADEQHRTPQVLGIFVAEAEESFEPVTSEPSLLQPVAESVISSTSEQSLKEASSGLIETKVIVLALILAVFSLGLFIYSRFA